MSFQLQEGGFQIWDESACAHHSVLERERERVTERETDREGEGGRERDRERDT
jgi:hypothetical protein